jgi:hypothetical protein
VPMTLLSVNWKELPKELSAQCKYGAEWLEKEGSFFPSSAKKTGAGTDVGLGGEVHDGIDLLFLEDVVDQINGEDVALPS